MTTSTDTPGMRFASDGLGDRIQRVRHRAGQFKGAVVRDTPEAWSAEADRILDALTSALERNLFHDFLGSL